MAVSALALGVIWALSAGTLDTHPAVDAGLIVGWLLMPVLLGLSLWRPTIRYGLIVPASLISLSLMAICVASLPEDPVAQLGWSLIAAGVMLGGVLGIWFWFQWLPVPAPLRDPVSGGRLSLIGVHATAILLGIGLVVLAILREASPARP